MDLLARFILRFLLVPFGGVVAVCIAVIVVMAAHWNAFLALATADPDLQENYLLALFLAGPALAMVLAFSAFMMLWPAAFGVLIAETFAIRSWIFHAANGGLSAWIGWRLIADIRDEYRFFSDPTIVVAAGLAAGFSYWLVAGWTAGFWKPIGKAARVSEVDRR
jgi:hypothetical protein